MMTDMSESGEELGALPTEARNPRSERIDELSTLDMLTVMNDEDATVAAAVRAALPAIAAVVDAVSQRFAEGWAALLYRSGNERAVGSAGCE